MVSHAMPSVSCEGCLEKTITFYISSKAYGILLQNCYLLLSNEARLLLIFPAFENLFTVYKYNSYIGLQSEPCLQLT